MYPGIQRFTTLESGEICTFSQSEHANVPNAERVVSDWNHARACKTQKGSERWSLARTY